MHYSSLSVDVQTSTKRHYRDQTSLCTALGLIMNHFKTMKQIRDPSASLLPEAGKCCRSFAESEPAQPLLRDFAVQGCSAASDSLPNTTQASPCDGLTSSQPETGMSGKEVRGLKLAVLVELQQLVRFRLQSALDMRNLIHPW